MRQASPGNIHEALSKRRKLQIKKVFGDKLVLVDCIFVSHILVFLANLLKSPTIYVAEAKGPVSETQTNAAQAGQASGEASSI